MRASRPLRLGAFMTTLAMLCGLAIPMAIGADKKASREREALQRMRQQVQQLSQEKAALEAKLAGFEQEKAALAQEKEKLASRIRDAEARASGEGRKRTQLEGTLDAASKEKQSLLEQKNDLEKRLAEMTARQAETARELATTKTQKQQADTTAEARGRQIANCEDKNMKLYQHGRDLIEQCQDRSKTDAMLRLEPFTALKRVEIENLLESYRDKLDAQKLLPGEHTSKASGTGTARPSSSVAASD